jgi:hypothetical protein
MGKFSLYFLIPLQQQFVIYVVPPSKRNDLDFVSKKLIRDDMYKYGMSLPLIHI